MSVAEEADQIVADPDRIEQAVDNLFTNALRQASAGGSIELRAACEGDAIDAVGGRFRAGGRRSNRADSGLAFSEFAKAIV